MGDVRVVQAHADHRRVGIGDIRQPLHLAGKVRHGATFRDDHVAPAGPRLTGQEDVAGPVRRYS
jgi:hypothetical protein